ncbi:Phosphatidylinositol transfer protein PDR16 [Babesia sp. Xinjiang]|uniref:Phosphatidylinositol transfer protein PDR16 n=1 Tax=Babesia sp. Xinjiang TaxID=462227 RepID=UPI000A235360|nr:Phosphatidylinositol transfer protein PDR16 [Babesia sp. Xinjiang]ORM40665.1 Phosphatidylinositol transfer protein PDR16 [Babesia sp. Xinjiang]
MDFIKLFKRKPDSSEEQCAVDSVDPIDIGSLGLVEGIGPPLKPDYRSLKISLPEFLSKWKTFYPLEENVDSVIKKVEELKHLLWSMPMYKSENSDASQGRKWYKLWNVDPVEDIKITELEWCTDLLLFRYLRSYRYKVAQAFVMLRKTLAWRRFKKLDSINLKNVGVSNANGMVYRKGYDKSGRPILYYRPRDEVDFDRDNQALLIFFTLEQATQTLLLSRGNDKIVVIVDLIGWSMSKIPTLELVIDTVRACSEHYTDLMHEVIILDPPMLMDPLMQMIKAVLDSSTAKKIVMKQRGPKLVEYLKNKIDNSQIEESMGGANKSRYNHEVYWTNESKEALQCQQRAENWVKEHEAKWLERHKEQGSKESKVEESKVA